jgi:hypothetical protein
MLVSKEGLMSSLSFAYFLPSDIACQVCINNRGNSQPGSEASRQADHVSGKGSRSR